MAISFTNLGASVSGTATNPDLENNADLTSYANSSWTPPTAGLILLCVINNRATDIGSPPAISGNSLTWVQIVTTALDYGTMTARITFFGAIATGATTGATTADFGADTQAGCSFSFFQVEGVNLTDGVLAAVVQSPTNSGNPGTSGTVTFAAAGHSNNRPFGVAFHTNGTEVTTGDPDWTAGDSIVFGTPGHSLITQYRSDAMDTEMVGSWVTNTAWIFSALELRATNTHEERVMISGSFGISDSMTIEMFQSLAMAAIKAVSDIAQLDIPGNVAIASLKGVSETEQIDFNPTIGFQLAAGIDPSVIRTLNTTLGLGKLLSVTIDGTIVGLVTKGYVITLDFSTNPVTITSFRATNVEASDT